MLLEMRVASDTRLFAAETSASSASILAESIVSDSCIIIIPHFLEYSIALLVQVDKIFEVNLVDPHYRGGGHNTFLKEAENVLRG